MRIGTYNMINQVYGTKNTKKTGNLNSTSYANFKDEVSFSSMGKDMQIAKAALADAPDVRENLVKDIKTRIADGTYEVSDEDFANKLLEAYGAR